jgi:hypothetical protein
MVLIALAFRGIFRGLLFWAGTGFVSWFSARVKMVPQGREGGAQDEKSPGRIWIVSLSALALGGLSFSLPGSGRRPGSIADVVFSRFDLTQDFLIVQARSPKSGIFLKNVF